MRDSWCTPRWLADIIGRVDLDPCGNERSHIDAESICRLVDGEDGLATLPKSYHRVFINPPYSRGQVLRWVRHYLNTDFIFLLRWDPSTEWFAELAPRCAAFWFASRRINFEPPPGVRGGSNPFPHALYLANYPEGEFLNGLRGAGYLIDNGW